jgi:hypothetical protein
MQWSISEFNPALAAWLSSVLASAAAVLGDLAISFGPPGPDGGPPAQSGRAAQGINLHLLSVAPNPRATAHIELRTESRLVLRYLATGWAAHRDAADLVVCALAFGLLGAGAAGPDGQSDIIVDVVPPALGLFAALGIAPQPALAFELPLVQIDAVAPARRVLHPPVVQAGLAAALSGIVLGPDELPIAAAQIEFPMLGRVTQTDPLGQFRFVGIPADFAGQTLRVSARGIACSYQLAGGSDGGSVTLRMSFAEGG